MRDKIQILCYGDSNTWGCIGRWHECDLPSRRYDVRHRWPDVLQAELGDAYHVISEGLGGRTTIYSRPGEEWKSGETCLRPCLRSHRPLDLVIVMLGTNDLHVNQEMTEETLPVGISRLADMILGDRVCGRDGKPPKLLILAPAEVQPSSPEGRVHVYDKFRREIGRNLSLKFPEVYAKVAEEKGCYFLNAADYAVPGPADGVHLDPDSHVRLGKAVAGYIRENIPLERDMQYLDGSRSRLVMRIRKEQLSVQGMGVWEDRAFVLYDSGVCGVYDLKTRQEDPLAVFHLGSYNPGTPARDYRNHANSCMFSGIHYGGNPIPLLYVSIGTGTGYDQDGYYYRCAVENIRRSADETGKESYTAETVQIISYHPDGIEKTGFSQPCWGCPCFLADTEEGSLYLFSARYRTKRGCVPDGGHNSFIITRFALPDVQTGGMVRLTPADILDQFQVDSDVQFTQGGTIVDGKLYYTFGCPQAGYPLSILVFDLKKKCLCAQVTDLDEALEREELECCAFYDGKMLFNTNAKDHGSIFCVTEGALPL